MRTLAPLAVLVPVLAAHAGGPALTTEVFVQGVANPTYLTFAPGDPDRVFITEQGGDVRVVVNGVLQATPFLDLDALVPNETFNGLLGIAFDPDYQENGYFYLHHPLDTGGGSASERIAVARYTVTANPNVADPASRHVIFEMNYPSLPGHHVGGWLGFRDGLLYMSFGDGGTTGQETPGGGRAQSKGSPWGKVLRVDPHGDDFPADPNRNYAIPASNPFVGEPGADEAVWVLGLRQPFRCDFDNETGDFYIADVGLHAREEIDFQRSVSVGGENYGWNCAEGTLCSSNGNCTCGSGIRGPIHEYNTSSAGNCSLSGGAIYRGCAIDGLAGTYFYGDWCSDTITSFLSTGGSVSNVTNRTVELNNNGEPTITNITGISEDYYGELYICSQNDRVYKIIPAGGIVDDNDNGIADSCETSLCTGDANGDGTVNVDDLNAVILDWGTDGSANGGDVTGATPDSPPDGIVDVNDLNAVVVNWGPCS